MKLMLSTASMIARPGGSHSQGICRPGALLPPRWQVYTEGLTKFQGDFGHPAVDLAVVWPSTVVVACRIYKNWHLLIEREILLPRVGLQLQMSLVKLHFRL